MKDMMYISEKTVKKRGIMEINQYNNNCDHVQHGITYHNHYKNPQFLRVVAREEFLEESRSSSVDVNDERGEKFA